MLMGDANEKMVIDQKHYIYNHIGDLFATQYDIHNRDKK